MNSESNKAALPGHVESNNKYVELEVSMLGPL